MWLGRRHFFGRQDLPAREYGPVINALIESYLRLVATTVPSGPPGLAGPYDISLLLLLCQNAAGIQRGWNVHVS